MEQLKAAEEIRNGVRADMIIQKDEEILTHNRTLVAQNADLYELGVKLSLFQKDYAQAWDWIQRGKARVLLDLLGLRGNKNVPTTFMASAMATERGKELLDTEVKLLQDCNAASPADIRDSPADDSYTGTLQSFAVSWRRSTLTSTSS